MTVSRVTTTSQALQRPRVYWMFADTGTLFKRSLYQIFNAPGQIGVIASQPILLIVLMTILFGKAIHTGTSNYVTFLVPGILIGSALQVATVAMIGVASDMTTGMIDRFRSLPMIKAAIFGGTVLSSAARCLLAVAAALVTGFVMGFHSSASIGIWVVALGLVFLVSYAFSWLFAVLGLMSKSVETAQQMSGVVWVLFFVSGVFEPIRSMPSWLQGFATNQPITQTVYAVRALLLKQPVGNHVWVTVIWCIGIITVSIPVAGWLFKRKFQ